ncbi:MAG: DUF4831 family protein [Salinivirgaceae bacterium]|nr:DUF4831 family protein [Salinivirgaceae bacterium]
MKKIYISIIILIACITVYAQKDFHTNIDVRRASVKQVIDGYQLYYSLPKNIIRIELTIKKTNQIAGPYAKYASKYLNISEGYIPMDNEFYEINNIEFQRYSKPDSNQVFVITAKGLGNLPGIQLNEDGVILGCNVGQPLTGYDTKTCQMQTPPVGESEYFFTDFGIKPFLKEKTEKGFRMVQTDSISVKVPYSKESWIEKTDEEIAEEIANLIVKIKKRKLKLLLGDKGEVNALDGLAMEVSMAELEKIENDYLSLFTGITQTSEQKFYFDYDPDIDIEAEQQIVVWFSPSNGLSIRKPEIRKKDFNPIVVKSNVIGKVSSPKIEMMNTSEKTPVPIKYGLYYRIPGRINMSIEYDNNILAKKQMEVTQKGLVVPMPVSYLNAGFSIQFYPETGGIKSIHETAFIKKNN